MRVNRHSHVKHNGYACQPGYGSLHINRSSELGVFKALGTIASQPCRRNLTLVSNQSLVSSVAQTGARP